MSNDLMIVTPTQGSLTTEVIKLQEKANELRGKSVAENTKRAYESDWEDFAAWCSERGFPILPTATQVVAMYLTHLFENGYTDKSGQHHDYTVATLQRRMSGISKAQRAFGHPRISIKDDPALEEVWHGIVNERKEAQYGAAPLWTEDLRKMIDALPVVEMEQLDQITDPIERKRAARERLQHVRDRAIILLGFAAALRRSELVALQVEDVRFERDGLKVLIRKSKTDQSGKGHTVGVVYGSNPDTCPVRTLKDWLDASGLTTGPLFRSINNKGEIGTDEMDGGSVARIIKRAGQASGVNTDKLSGHSLRAGFATVAAANGEQERVIQRTTRHKNLEVLRRYIRDGDLFRENAGRSLGL